MSDVSSLLGRERQDWRDEVCAFLDEHRTPALVTELQRTRGRNGGPEEKAFRAAMRERGYYAVSWPKEYGGLERDATDQMILLDELDYRRLPRLHPTVTSLGPAIIALGTEVNRKEYLTGIANGTYEFALGYSEPGSGSDLASLRTRAELDGDDWVINGQKVWTSAAHYSTHFWLAVRTGDPADRYRSISILAVPCDAPGVTIREIKTWADVRTNEVFFDNVRVPKDSLIGGLDKGWDLVRTALSYERLAVGLAGRVRRHFDDLLELCSRSGAGGERLVDDPLVAARLAEVKVRIDAAQLMNYRTVAVIQEGREPIAEASAQKIWTTELMAEVSALAMELLGDDGLLDSAEVDSPAGGDFEWTFREVPFMRFGGGTNEIQRDILAQTAMSLPRSR